MAGARARERCGQGDGEEDGGESIGDWSNIGDGEYNVYKLIQRLQDRDNYLSDYY